MTYDLRREPWIPWRRRGGTVEWGPPAMLLDRLSGDTPDPVVAIAAPRPDLDGAVQEFLIGLLSAALAPADEAAWRRSSATPPTVEELQRALDALPDAFDLDGDGPRFFQDLTSADFASVEPNPIEVLLIDAPGEQTQKLNKDLFVKRDRVERLSRPAAAMVLLTMQTYAPSGGQGYRTSMRGGGPLTTLVDPRVDEEGAWRAYDQPLWLKLWANVETAEQLTDRTPPPRKRPLETALPWLAPTRTSNTKKGGTGTSPTEGHPLQAYFGLPRRIRLEFGDAGTCDLTGMADERTVTGFRAINYGVQYVEWKHPHSPHYRQKVSESWLPLHGQPEGVGWRDWLTLTLSAPSAGLREPAAVVSHFQEHRADRRRPAFRVHAFGYDMESMKARGWVDAIVPAFAVGDAEHRALLYTTGKHLTEATSMAATALLGAVKTALFQSPDDAPGDLGRVKQELWRATEGAFYATVESLVGQEHDSDAVFDRAPERRRAFLGPLTDAAVAIFDRWCPPGLLPPDKLRRRVTARHDLLLALRGYSKLGESIFAELGVALPGGGRTARAATKKKTRTKEKAP